MEQILVNYVVYTIAQLAIYHSYLSIYCCLIANILLITDIAVQSNVTVGKWMIFRERSMIDDTWQMISEATIAGKLGCSSKVVAMYT